MASNSNSLISNLLVLLISAFICSLPLVSSLAFCRQKNSGHDGNIFPLANPERHIPWVWEAVYHEENRIVEVTTISRTACSFNHTGWHRVVELFPQYASQLGGGLESNVLVPAEHIDNFDYAGYKNLTQGLNGKTVHCVYYFEGKEVWRSESHLIRGVPYWLTVSTLQIRCPSPPLKLRKIPLMWDAMTLQRDLTELYGDGFINSDSNNETEPFPVCKVPRSPPTLVSELAAKLPAMGEGRTRPVYLAGKRRQIYNLTVCSATARSNRKHLVEWIEYHLLMGVDHFYLYDTSAARKQGKLASDLSDYIAEGIVTIVSWPYLNCVRGMSSGRGTWWLEEWDQVEFTYFQPPRAVAQTAALASCYSRFRYFSRYMAHIDDDEFFAITHEDNAEWGPALHNLPDLADKLFLQNPKAPAIRFFPVNFFDCSPLPITDPDSTSDMELEVARIKQELQVHPSQLPRIRKWLYGKAGYDNEGKMILRTDSVGMYFVHYVTLVDRYDVSYANDSIVQNFDDIYMPKMKHATLFHYKEPAAVSGSIFGSRIPFERGPEAKECRKDRHELNFEDFTVKQNRRKDSGKGGGGSGGGWGGGAAGLDAKSQSDVGSGSSLGLGLGSGNQKQSFTVGKALHRIPSLLRDKLEVAYRKRMKLPYDDIKWIEPTI